jgi:hypothetical protein
MAKTEPVSINERVVNLLRQVSEQGLISVARRDDLTSADRCLLEMFAGFGESKTAEALKASRLKGRAAEPSKYKVVASGAADRVAPESAATRRKRKSDAEPNKAARKAPKKGATKKGGRK